MGAVKVEPLAARSLLTWGLVMQAYVLLGAVLFRQVESPKEEALVATLLQAKAEILKKHACLSDARLEPFLNQVVEAAKSGVCATDNSSCGDYEVWGLGESFVFTVAVILTVGYGNTVPLSPQGMLVFVAFSIVGIHLWYDLLVNFSDKLADKSLQVCQNLQDKLKHHPSSANVSMCYNAFLGSIILYLIIFLPAAVFSYLEPDWSYFDAIYYCVISLTKIGLGDYVPATSPYQKHRFVYQVLTAVWLLVSVLLGMVFSSVMELVFCNMMQNKRFSYLVIN